MNSYFVKKNADINTLPFEKLDSFPWPKYADYKPYVGFRVTHTDSELRICLRCYEENPVAVITRKNGPVCNDSCMEFFFSPSPDNSNGYFNFEVNSNPTYLLEYGPCTCDNSKPVEWDDSEFGLTTTYGEDEGKKYWQIDFSLPYAMIKKYAPTATLNSGDTIRANVYKCGVTEQPAHFFSWNFVDTEGPMFHCPPCFGSLILE